MRYFVAGACAALLLGVFVLSSETLTGGEKKEFKKIGDVMKFAHTAKKGEKKVCEKFVEGTASADEKKNLLAAYEFLATCKSPNGKDDAWKTTTEALAKAVKDGNGEALAATLKCKACHETHKKPKAGG